jgi:pseudaminic acid biosynthesis-associated methylase
LPSKIQSTEQARTWNSDFGREYTDRNPVGLEQLDDLYRRNYGVTRTEVNRRFLSEIPKGARILEVGCNIGNQLLSLKQMGFSNLYGIDVQQYALEKARRQISDATLTEASALAIPYPDRYFDLVFTSGVLIHIAPDDLPRALAEIHRCARQWIWGVEYFSPQTTEVQYRGHSGLLWKTDYAARYRKLFPALELVREDRLCYIGNSNIDTVFMLRRTD